MLNLLTFFTHQPTLSIVKLVTDATLPTFKLGVPVMPKPGTVLIKFKADPRVYVTTENPKDPYRPILRRISDEDLAVRLFGENWEDFILELDEAFFGRFVIGEDIIIEVGELIPIERLRELTGAP